MFEKEINLRPVDHITVDAIGEPGQRTFMLQGWKGDRSVTLIVEKTHVQLLAAGVEELLKEVERDHAGLAPASGDYEEGDMRIDARSEAWFRVGELGIGYDEDGDLVALVAKELLEEERQAEEPRIARFWATRSQMKAMAGWGLDIAARGRPICAQCGEPIDPNGHFCPKRNGHQRRPT
jgi:uncharacterized repeat protein (TIGR03847 family)